MSREKQIEEMAFKINKESLDRLFPKHEIVGYESPINVVIGQMRMEYENGIYKAIQEQGVTVDKDELIKALQYDRNQYDKGYINGYKAKASEVVWEIFDKVDEIAYRYLNDADYSGGDMIYDLNELKKKYTEEGK